MADEGGSDAKIPENPLLVQLVARGVEDDARMLRGFIGPSRRDGFVTLYQRLDRLSDSMEIARNDILHFVEAPRSELGAVILWVKKDAKISVRKLEASEISGAASQHKNLREVRKGRLRMHVRARARDDVCQSVCDPCISWCDCLVNGSHCEVKMQ
jgi:hypothetical protein